MNFKWKEFLPGLTSWLPTFWLADTLWSAAPVLLLYPNPMATMTQKQIQDVWLCLVVVLFRRCTCLCTLPSRAEWVEWGRLWFSLYIPWGAGFIAALIMRDRPAMPSSHSSFSHPSVLCVRLLFPLICFLPSTDHRSQSFQRLFSLSFSANFNILPWLKAPSAPPQQFLSSALAPEGPKVPVSDSPSIFLCGFPFKCSLPVFHLCGR